MEGIERGEGIAAPGIQFRVVGRRQRAGSAVEFASVSNKTTYIVVARTQLIMGRKAQEAQKAQGIQEDQRVKGGDA